MSVPQKFRAIGDFHEYYSGARKAPYLTLFIGGNHEASSHLQELYYGGWVAPKIYYMGAGNVLQLGGLRIAGLSGIWKGFDYNKAHIERLPYSDNEIKSIYHVREIDVRKLLLLKTPVDVGISHDWPRSIEWEGDYKTLFRQKDRFEHEAREGTLGSLAAKYVMNRLRPRYWFSAHMHCKFAALVDHVKEGVMLAPGTPPVGANGRASSKGSMDLIESSTGTSNVSTAQPDIPAKNIDEIDLDLSDDEAPVDPPTNPTSSINVPTKADPPAVFSTIASELRSQLPAAFRRPQPTLSGKQASSRPPPAITNRTTHFLALDKCLPKRDFLQILDIDTASDSDPPLMKLTYDKEWLAILRVFAAHDPHQPSPHNVGEATYAPLIVREEEWVEDNLVKQGKMDVPEDFEMIGPVYDGKAIGSVGREQPKAYSNPQTKSFCTMLGIPNWFDEEEEAREERRKVKAAKNETERLSGGNRGGWRGGGRGGGRDHDRRRVGGGGGRGTGRGFR